MVYLLKCAEIILIIIVWLSDIRARDPHFDP